MWEILEGTTPTAEKLDTERHNILGIANIIQIRKVLHEHFSQNYQQNHVGT